MARVDIPNFGELLAEHLGGVPPEAYPYLLSFPRRRINGRWSIRSFRVPSQPTTPYSSRMRPCSR